MQAYCSTCRTQRELVNAQVVKTSDGKLLTRGSCAVCGSPLMRLGGTTPAPRQGDEPRAADKPITSTPPASQPTLPLTPNAPPSKPAQPESAPPAAARKPTSAKPTTARAKRASKPKARVVRKGRAEDDDDGAEARSNVSARGRGGEGAALVIVESPAKAKTVGKFLGGAYRVRASIGHIRDLPVKSMGVEIDNDFKPQYEITAKKRDVVQELREFARDAHEIYLATDPDREGEAISWHLAAALKSQIAGKPVHRVEFHEITQDAIRQAFSHPRAVNMDRVNAQQARRVLDRIVGYTLSPLIAKKLHKWTLSAGRVQSVAVRMVVEREREIQNFVAVEYWSIEAELKKQAGAPTPAPPNVPDIFRARLVKINAQEFECHTGEEALRLKEVLEACAYRVSDVRRKDVTRNPNPPYITSTLQQDASRRLGFNPKRTMKVAQELYEGLNIGAEGTVGLITYMRTDSTNIAESAQNEARAYIQEKFGQAYLPAKPRVYSKKVAGAQEAHEAIRPTKTLREPNAIREYLDHDQYRLYDLIWKRFVASQMASAIFDTTAVDILAQRKDIAAAAPAPSAPPTPERAGEPVALETAMYLLRANGSILKFAGYLAVYGRSVGDEDEEDDSDKRLPPLDKDEPLDLLGIYPEQHFTEPPPRYTEATLIKALEQHGIGRPSTYAPILANVQERGYIEQVENRRLKPTELGFVVNDLLVAHFAKIVDLDFTAQMEEKLDAVEAGKQDWVALLREFYGPFQEDVARAAQEMPMMRIEDEKTDVICDVCGAPMVIKRGKKGKFLSCSRFPACKNAQPITTGVRCPKCKEGKLAERKSKKGRIFYGCTRYPQCDFATWDKPLAEACPKCGGLMVQVKNLIRCVNGDYSRAAREQSVQPSPEAAADVPSVG